MDPHEQLRIPPLADHGVPGVLGAPAPLPSRPPEFGPPPPPQPRLQRLLADEASELMAGYQRRYFEQCTYWSLRWTSRSGQGLLVFLVDRRAAMFAYCAWPWAPGRLDDVLVRPRLVETAAMFHGHEHLLLGEWGSLALDRQDEDLLDEG